jgi:acyl-CoA synthetase (NDP forming)
VLVNTETLDRRSAIVAMLEARSVAVVGASAREGSFGEQMLRELRKGGYGGTILPVNPRYADVAGLPCVPALADLSEPPDLVMLGVPNARLEEQLQAAAARGARSAAIFASGYEAQAGERQSLLDRLAAIAKGAGMAICGGNCMGFFNLDRQLRVTGFNHPDELIPGGITFISHSGSAFSAMLHNDRSMRFNLVVSAGQELATTSADYLAYALEQPTTKAVALFIETVRDPAGFRSALDAAAARDVPVVVLKVGRAEAARDLITAHSGALAGEDGAYEALFDAHGVLRVDTLDEMADTLELLVAGRRAAAGGLAAIHDSGGERALLVDAAEANDVPLARIGEPTVGRLAAVLEEGLPPVNPLDAWGTGNNAEDIFIECMRALLDDPDTAALAFCVDLTPELVEEAGYTRVANEVFAATGKPVAVLSNLASAIHRRDAAFVRRRGIPVLEGTTTGLRAFRHLFDYRDWRARSDGQRAAGATAPVPPVAADVVERWSTRLTDGSCTPFGEAESLALLADFGVPVVEHRSVASFEGAVAAADQIGWPVALKTAVPTALHKSDAGGVHLGIRDNDALRVAYEDCAVRLGPEVTVAAMAPPGTELALGIVHDEQFGPLVLVGAGGILVEFLQDRRLALPPVDPAGARRMLDRLAMRPLLDGVRGAAPANLDAVAAAIVALAGLAVSLGDHIAALDVNPIIAGEDGCVAVDALVVPRPAPPRRPA